MALDKRHLRIITPNDVKDKLAQVFVMKKGAGWGKHTPGGLKNGDWIFATLNLNGDHLDVDYSQCRNCHLFLEGTKDYAHCYDEYFQKQNHSH
jgi:hypothetical protein